MIGDCKMTHLSPTEWRKRVQKKIGKIPNEVWTVIIEKGFIEVANEEEELGEGGGLGYLLERIEEELVSYSSYANIPKLPKQQQGQDMPPREIPPDKRFQALSRIISILANHNDEILEFRQEVLNGKLLKPEEVPEWIKSTAEKEGHTLTVTLNVPAGDNPGESLVEQAKQVASGFEQGKFVPGVGYSNVYLSYVNPRSEWREVVPINKSGILGRLKHLAEQYKAFWPEPQAVNFILTGIAYPISHARVRTRISCLSKVTLEVSPHLPGSKIKKLYLEERKKLLKLTGKKEEKSRRLTEKHLTLAVFVVEEMGSWAMKLRKWNRKYPQWAYPETARSTFARDCRKAYERLTGWKWRENNSQ